MQACWPRCALLLNRCSPLCAAVKKPAPAPPKPGNPPSSHAGGQSSPGTAQHTPSVSPKPAATGSPSPPTQHPGQAPGPPGTASQPPAPRRSSSSLAPIHAPSHPPPQPPTQARPGSQGVPSLTALPSEHGLEQPAHTPPQTPTPPSTPPLGKQNPSPPASQNQAAGYPETAQLHAGTLPRPRPVPKPRNRPSVPPPPHPPGAHPAGDSSLTNAMPTASKIVTGEWGSVPGFCPLPAGFPFQQGQHTARRQPDLAPRPMFANKVLLAHSHTHLFTCCLGCFCAKTVELLERTHDWQSLKYIVRGP